MRVFIAEKPDLAKIISEGISGSVERKNGYIIKGNDILTWCFGHLLSLDEPEAYGDEYKKWSVSVLPIPFKYCVKRDNNGKIDKGAKEQLAIIKELVNRSDVTEVVHCGDADEEGQLLVDEVLSFLKVTKPVKRLLLHDLSSSAVAKEIKSMKSNSEYKGISESGYARSQADWLVGLSLTRSVSVMMNKGGVYSIGRVSTPILSLIVNRDLEREQHKVSYYYAITGKFGDIIANYDVKENIVDESEARRIVNECNGKDSNLVVTKSHKSSSAPLVYNLLKLQVDCAKLYNYKPEKVLEITQQLREKYRAITYNRSDCEYLPESIWDDRNRILDSIKDIVDVSKLDRSKKSKCFNDKNITAHFGIIPNGDKVNINSMNEQERNVYTLIAKRFAMQFMEDKEWDSYELVYTIDNKHIFKKTINVVTKMGWDDEEVGKALDISNGVVKCDECKYEQKETKAKPAYTMSTLLSDMCSIAKYVKDSDLEAREFKAGNRRVFLHYREEDLENLVGDFLNVEKVPDGWVTIKGFAKTHEVDGRTVAKYVKASNLEAKEFKDVTGRVGLHYREEDLKRILSERKMRLQKQNKTL